MATVGLSGTLQHFTKEVSFGQPKKSHTDLLLTVIVAQSANLCELTLLLMNYIYVCVCVVNLQMNISLA